MRQFSPTFRAILLVFGIAILIHANDNQSPEGGRRKSGLAPVGYDDNQLIPGQSWKVHDIARPEPYVIEAGTSSTPTVAGTAPSDATVLFDGSSADGWENGKMVTLKSTEQAQSPPNRNLAAASCTWNLPPPRKWKAIARRAAIAASW